MAIAEAMLSRSDRRVHLVGHSYGGHIAARTALRHSNRIASLTLIEPTLFYLLPEAGELPAYAEVHALAAATIEDVEAGRGDQAAERFLDYWIGSG